MDNISSDFQENNIFPTHTASGGRARSHYDLTLTSWDLMLERINSLNGNERVDFLESLFSYPPVGRCRLKKRHEESCNKYFPLDKVQLSEVKEQVKELKSQISKWRYHICYCPRTTRLRGAGMIVL